MPGEQWCARRLLARIHIYTQKRLRQEIEPVTARDFLRFLLRWQHVAPGTQRHGRAGLVAVIEQLQGFELPAGTWEGQVLPARLAGYRAEWLDQLCHTGEVAWGRLRARDSTGAGSGAGAGSDSGDVDVAWTATITSRATPITLLLRADLPVAAASGPRRCRPRWRRPPAPAATSSTLWAAGAPCFCPSWPPRPDAFPPRSKTRCGTAWPAAW